MIGLIFLSFFVSACTIAAASQHTISPHAPVPKQKKYVLNRRLPTLDELTIRKPRARYPDGVTKASKFMGGIMKDMFLLNKNIISWDSFAIIASMFPLFIGTRMIDDDIQRYFL